jgi:hypothetical protein
VQYGNVERDDLAYNKIHKIRWLVDAIRERCKAAWNLGKNLTINEMMVRGCIDLYVNICLTSSSSGA